jgi:exo-1,4-beta-D-glucosaminidase
MNEHNGKISVINTKHKAQFNLTADVRVYDFDLNIKWQKQEQFTIGEDRYLELFTVSQPPKITPVYFVKLLLKNEKGTVVSDNFYWLSKDGKNDFRDIAKMPKVDLKLGATTSYKDDEVRMTVKVKNTSDKLAFMHRLMITKGEGGDEVLPTFWSDNFLTLFPGEERTVTASFAKQDLEGKKPLLALDKNQ